MTLWAHHLTGVVFLVGLASLIGGKKDKNVELLNVVNVRKSLGLFDLNSSAGT